MPESASLAWFLLRLRHFIDSVSHPGSHPGPAWPVSRTCDSQRCLSTRSFPRCSRPWATAAGPPTSARCSRDTRAWPKASRCSNASSRIGWRAGVVRSPPLSKASVLNVDVLFYLPHVFDVSSAFPNVLLRYWHWLRGIPGIPNLQRFRRNPSVITIERLLHPLKHVMLFTNVGLAGETPLAPSGLGPGGTYHFQNRRDWIGCAG